MDFGQDFCLTGQVKRKTVHLNPLILKTMWNLTVVNNNLFFLTLLSALASFSAQVKPVFDCGNWTLPFMQEDSVTCVMWIRLKHE